MFTKLAQVVLVAFIGVNGLAYLCVSGWALYGGAYEIAGTSFFLGIGAIILTLFLAGKFFDKKDNGKNQV